jgi:hypothetical protein
MAYPNALTLGQYAIQSNDPLVAAVTYSLIDNGSIMARDIPFVPKKSLKINGVRWEGNLPPVNWSQINVDPTVVSGTPTPYAESAYLLRNEIQVDKVLVEEENQISDPRATQVEAYLKSAAYDFNNKFVNNDHVTGDSNAIVGIRSRIDNGGTFGVRPENKINGGGVDLTSTGMTAATFNSFMEQLDQLLWSVDSPDGDNVTLYTCRQVLWRINRGMRQFAGQGGFSQNQDQYGRGVTQYKNATFRDAGNMADQVTQIITNTETSAGAAGSSTYSSIYGVNFGETHMFGWQFGNLVAKDLGLRNGGVIYSTLIDWAGGLANASNRSLGRIYGLKLA